MITQIILIKLNGPPKRCEYGEGLVGVTVEGGELQKSKCTLHMYEIVRFNESYKKISLGRPTFIYHFPGVPKNQKAEMTDLCVRE